METTVPHVQSSRRGAVARALPLALFWAGLSAAGLCACKATPAGPPPMAGDAVPSTDGRLALGNLDAQIEGQESLLRRQPGALDALSGLIELLGTRSQLLGRLGDLDRVEELGELAVQLHPDSGEALRLRAQARAALHRFAEALADADRAEQLGEEPAHLLSVRGSVLLARGDSEGALALLRAQAARAPGIRSLGALAAAEGQRGDLSLALGHFDAAIASYRDVSPLPLAWIDFQRGLVFEHAGQLVAAEGRYRMALRRLPSHAQAKSHLAALLVAQGQPGFFSQASALLAPLVASSDDPEYPGQLAALLDLTGHTAEAGPLRAQASAGYARLLQKHPAAFADHAARFFLPFDPARALPLAEGNVAVRPTWEAFDLALSAAVAAQDQSAGCRLQAQLAGRTAPRRVELLARRACNAAGPDAAPTGG